MELLAAPISNIEGSRPLQETYPGTTDPSPDSGPYGTLDSNLEFENYFKAWNGTDQADGKAPSFEILSRNTVSPVYPDKV